MSGRNPYPGLRPFQQEDADLFFGRESVVDDLLVRLERGRFLAVTGGSGCGKSSLIFAGLLPALQGGHLTKAGSRWRFAALRPARHPVESLAAALEAALGSKGVEQTLRRSSLGLGEAVRLARLAPSENVLVIVDQFEELFRLGTPRDEPMEFVRLLLEAARQSEEPIYLVISLRSAYFAECAEFRDLPAALNDGFYLVPRMTRDQLRSAIEDPAAIENSSVSSSLVQRVLNDLYEHPDYLPAMQHALWRTWQASRQLEVSSPISLMSYEQVGGLESLNHHAEEVYHELGPGKADIARIVFQRLTETMPDGRVIRRPTRVAELCEVTGVELEELAGVVTQFQRAMLMLPVGSLEPESISDLTHESLARQWWRLASWVAEEAQDAKIYRRLEETAILWKQGQADLLRGVDLKVAKEWVKHKRPREAWAHRYGTEFHQVMQLIAVSNARRWRLW